MTIFDHKYSRKYEYHEGKNQLIAGDEGRYYEFEFEGQSFKFVNSVQFKHLRKLLKTYSVNELHLDSILASYVSTFRPVREDDPPHQVFDFDFIVENQRGTKLFGIPLFSNNILIPYLDPSHYQLLNGNDILLNYNNINNYPLPDLNWKWCWESWYVLMIDDVDDQGWVYLHMLFRRNGSWKGKYYFGNFVRKRIWMKMRYQVTEPDNPENESILTFDDKQTIVF